MAGTTSTAPVMRDTTHMGMVQVVDEKGEQVKQRFFTFLEQFVLPEDESRRGWSMTSQMSQSVHSTTGTAGRASSTPEYVRRAEAMVENDRTSLPVDVRHLLDFDPVLAEAIVVNFYRYNPFLRKAVQNFVRMQRQTFSVGGEYNKAFHDDFCEREFFIEFYQLPQVEKIRGLHTNKIGKLVSVTGTVIRTSEVRPELLYGTFRCVECDEIVKDVEQQFKYTTPQRCPGHQCTNTKEWELDLQQSKFVDWQRLRVQENSDEIPPGGMPRSLDVIVRHDSVDRAKAGDKCVFNGTLIVIPDVSKLFGRGEGVTATRGGNSRGEDGHSGDGVRGLKALGVRDLTYKLAFLCSSITPSDKHFHHWNIREDQEEGEEADDEAIMEKFTLEEREEIRQMKKQPNLYHKMARSIAPRIFGHDDIKRGILLMLFGGVHKTTSSGTKLRGDVNICVVGDPSTAKSQFLKYVVDFLPRAVYTSGKGSTAAGLTASVARDVDTGEYGIEAGALMLADNGICCIDEFDKMDSKDQVAIHEAMEQQTISIAKAGIKATLNARTSILAAANPIFGRYDRSKTLRENVTMTAPIMSRFDLFFVVLDDCDDAIDTRISDHIINLHRGLAVHLEADYPKVQLQRYIRFARSFNPQITDEARKTLCQCYTRLRQNDVVGGTKKAYRITVRQLESMVRLSEALARLCLEDEVKPDHVMEAFRLLKQSIVTVEANDVDLSDFVDKSSEVEIKKLVENQDDEGDEDGADEGNASEQDSKQDPVDDENEGPGAIKGNDSGGKPIAATAADSADDTAATDANIEQAPTKPAGKSTNSITWEKYSEIKNCLALHLRHTEEEEGATGVSQHELVLWYLSDGPRSHLIQSEKDLMAEKQLVMSIIERLITKDKSLIVVDSEDGGQDIDQRVIAVHPNYVIHS